jgi:hypothetical protein
MTDIEFEKKVRYCVVLLLIAILLFICGIAIVIYYGNIFLIIGILLIIIANNIIQYLRNTKVTDIQDTF